MANLPLTGGYERAGHIDPPPTVPYNGISSPQFRFDSVQPICYPYFIYIPLLGHYKQNICVNCYFKKVQMYIYEFIPILNVHKK